MFRRSRLKVASNTANRVLSSLERLRDLIATLKLVRAIRLLTPTLVAIFFASVAHAQGTMDFSGAQTLMGTFNMGSSTIQAQVVFPHRIQIISKQPVRTFDRQLEHIRELKQHAHDGMLPRPTQLR